MSEWCVKYQNGMLNVKMVCQDAKGVYYLLQRACNRVG